jgi:transposase, IS6 family
VLALRWDLAFAISYRDLAVMLSNRSIAVEHAICSDVCKPVPPGWSNGSGVICHKPAPWRLDETYIKAKGIWTYLYRAVEDFG